MRVRGLLGMTVRRPRPRPEPGWFLKSFQGEGTRGGRIIGHTKSGKAIYDRHAHPAHASFTTEDHRDAVELHDRLGEKAGNRFQKDPYDQEANDARWKHSSLRAHHEHLVYHPDARHPEVGVTSSGKSILHVPPPVNEAEEDTQGRTFQLAHQHFTAADHREAAAEHRQLAKQGVPVQAEAHHWNAEQHEAAAKFKGQFMKSGGEGSRGGKVVGHTKRGKAIYEKCLHCGGKGRMPADRFAGTATCPKCTGTGKANFTPPKSHELPAKTRNVYDGAKVIGHTSSGKAVHNHPVPDRSASVAEIDKYEESLRQHHKDFTPRDHGEAAKMHREARDKATDPMTRFQHSWNLLQHSEEISSDRAHENKLRSKAPGGDGELKKSLHDFAADLDDCPHCVFLKARQLGGACA